MDLSIETIFIVLTEKLKWDKKPIETENLQQEIPAVEFHYKFSPLSSSYEISRKNYFHFYIEIIAMIGSLIVFFEFVSGFINGTFKVYFELE